MGVRGSIIANRKVIWTVLKLILRLTINQAKVVFFTWKIVESFNLHWKYTKLNINNVTLHIDYSARFIGSALKRS